MCRAFRGPCSATSALKTGYRPSILCASCARWSMPCSASMSPEFEAVYERKGRPSVPPEMLLKALLLQILFCIRSERLLVEAIDHNLLYRWFVGLNIEDKVWDTTPPSAPTASACSTKTWRACSSSASSTAPTGRG